MLKRRLFVRCIGLAAAIAILASCGTSQLSATNATGRTFSMTLTTNSVSPVNDYFGTGARVIFSTAKGRKRPNTIVKLTNPTDSTITIDRITSTSSAFLVETPLPAALTLAPHESTSISIAFRPKSTGVTQASLTLSIAGASTLDITLAGINTTGIESSNEASLQSIFDVLGYGVDVAQPAHPPAGIPASKSDEGNSISMSNSAVGDEVLAPVFTKADESKPISLIPVANYMGRTTSVMGWLGINNAGSSTQVQRVLAFSGASDIWGGENQQVLPAYGDGSYSQLTSGSSINFEPRFTTFGFADQQHSVFSQDQLNYKDEHDVRVYPAKTAIGTPFPNSYLITEDSTASDHYKNYDYQDYVFQLSNVKPAV